MGGIVRMGNEVRPGIQDGNLAERTSVDLERFFHRLLPDVPISCSFRMEMERREDAESSRAYRPP
jgi:hypothetical protein